MSVAGKHIVITGATAGIGLATAVDLAEKGARLTLVARNADKAKLALEQVFDAGPEQTHGFVQMDFGDLGSVRAGAAQLAALNTPIDILLNNAGVVNTSRKLSADGFEETFAVNHLAPFLLTGLLLPFVRDDGGRIINVASEAHKFVKGMNFDDLQSENKYSTFSVYGQSKLANMLFTIELARRLKPRGISCNSLHPGAVSTGLGTQNGGLMGKILPLLLKPFFRTPLQGAATSIHLCCAEDVDSISGKYFSNCKQTRPKTWAEDFEAAERLWGISEELTGILYPE
jgi:retinol dehydrogenase 12